ncbi:PFL_4695 family integrating conjugative element protein [Denitromonas iodatirespirans]|uniref:Integrating conjugative element protein n=1 Tax=Denitromonas iodatirespirans TaxID=2795389 RepID=A0A944D8J1_DENI1|nr:integrating conjugative element protein [Denitromonas iodatirespirans]MBT0960321.1 integrating conjugative element protein [Denitromonas iodatirespirans]
MIAWLSALPLADAYAEAMPPSPEAPVVIFDGGGVPILDLINPETEDVPALSTVARAPMPVPAHVLVFPVVTRRGGPGTLAPNPQRPALPGGPGRPIAIVGDDTPSRAWLEANAARLREIGAAVMVVRVASEARFATLRVLADVPFAPASGDALLERLGVAVWPLLISADGEISQ